jgi:hypothetical protein
MTRFATIGRWLVVAAIVVFIAGTIGTIYLATRNMTSGAGPVTNTVIRVELLLQHGSLTLIAAGVLGVGGLLLQAVGLVIDEDEDDDTVDVAP